MTACRILDTITVEKPWGRDSLPAPFTGTGEGRIGEIWFDPPPEMPDVLVKYLFTSEKLSVQVHPSDAQAPEGSRGKEECWLVLDAEPDARLAVGFKQGISPEAMRAAALDGSIEDLLEWHPVARGDFFYLSAGTVHAIGAGLSILEIQQNSDITYRLFDYGRPRELHLDEAIAVAKGEPYPDSAKRRFDFDRTSEVVGGRHFRVDIVTGPDAAAQTGGAISGPVMVLPLEGAPACDGQTIAAGQAVLLSDLAGLQTRDGDTVVLASRGN
ncbi:class I mannose-6-phosphate isomerase [Altererythrobacter sp. CAU 1778]